MVKIMKFVRYESAKPTGPEQIHRIALIVVEFLRNGYFYKSFHKRAPCQSERENVSVCQIDDVCR